MWVNYYVKNVNINTYMEHFRNGISVAAYKMQ